jgi:hypothetical protein
MSRPLLTRFLVALASLTLLASCEQDPYRFLQNGDGGAKDLPNFVDGVPFRDLGPRDARGDGTKKLDFGVPDLSYDACRARAEVCNNVDDNCDGAADEGFDKQNDPRYCDSCKGCAFLFAKNAVPGCVAGACTISSCAGGFIDLDKDPKNGCEYQCTPTGPEMCDGVDNDCNGQIDEGVTVSQNTCLQLGACAGAKPVCRGTSGWICDYGPDVQLLPCTKDADCGSGISCDTVTGVCPGVVIGNETLCDGKDNDCDTVADDPWNNPTLSTAIGKECSPDPTKQGVCRAQGSYACNAAKTGVECKITTPAKAPSDEICNGLDDDCDGKTDEVADDAAGKGAKDTMVRVQRTYKAKSYDFWIYAYEASRPDATGSSSGAESAGRSCSRASVLPWGNVTYAQAKAACAATGKRLCTGAEWEAACISVNADPYPYGPSYQGQTCNGTDNGTGSGASLAAGTLASCEGGVSGIFDMSGNLREWTNDQRGTTSGSPKKKIYAVRGGAYHTPALGLSCTFDLSQAVEDVVLPANGFRCCADKAD